MAQDYDNTDRGAAFAPFQTQAMILQGKINDSGVDKKVVLVKDQTKNGAKIIEVFEKVGVLFENNKKGNDAAPDYSGPFNEFRRLAAWRKSKDGKPYMTFSVSDSSPQQESNQENHHQDLNDEIPPF